MTYYETTTQNLETIENLFNNVLKIIGEKLKTREIKLRKYVKYQEVISRNEEKKRQRKNKEKKVGCCTIL